MENELKSIEAGVAKFNEKAENLAAEVKGAKEAVDSVKADIKVIKDEADKNQKAIDQVLTDIKDIKNAKPASNKKSFGEAFSDAVEANWDEIQRVKKGQKFVMDVKAVGDMTLSGPGLLSGDSVASYSSRQAILPAQKINFRDLIPTVSSDTGLYVQYRESAGEGSISVQTEGSSKTQIDFDFSEVKVVNDYIAGWARFTKQMLKSLPFMQNTLPRLLLREFFKAENAQFFSVINAAATGSTTTAETDDVKQIIDYIASLRDANFSPSFGMVSHTQYGRLQKLTYGTGYYAGSGGVAVSPDGSMVISGVPVIGASWVTDDKVLLIDRDYIERVEVEGVKVEFFEQDGTNVRENKITARVECYEDINLMLTGAATYADLGNVA